ARGNHPWAALAELTRLRVSLDAVLGAADSGPSRSAGQGPVGAPGALGPSGADGAGGSAGVNRTGDAKGAAGPGGAGRAGGQGYGRIAAEAERLAGRLRAYGLPRDAALAELIAARAYVAARRRDDAARCLAVAGGRGLPLEAVLLRRLTRAELAAGAG